MLELARDRADGAHVYHVNIAHTAQSREILGPDAFLGVEQPVTLEPDPENARAIAREHLHRYLNQKYNIAKFRRLGYTEDDISNGGSHRIVDDLVFWGDLESVVKKLRGHIEAGADHVGIQVLGIQPGESAMPQWRELARALLTEVTTEAPLLPPRALTADRRHHPACDHHLPLPPRRLRRRPHRAG
jgi:probable F420-dependent oxidoreductase